MKKLIMLLMSLILCLTLASCTDPEVDPDDLIDKGNNGFLDGPGVETEIIEIPFN